MQNVGTDFRQVSKRHIIFLGHGSASCVCVGSNVLWSGRNLEDNANVDQTEITIFKFSTCVKPHKGFGVETTPPACSVEPVSLDCDRKRWVVRSSKYKIENYMTTVGI